MFFGRRARNFFPLDPFDRRSNLHEKFFCDGAGGVSQVMQDSGGRKLGNAGKVILPQILAGVQAAAGEDGVLHAGGQEVPKAYLQIEIVQFL